MLIKIKVKVDTLKCVRESWHVTSLQVFWKREWISSIINEKKTFSEKFPTPILTVMREKMEHRRCNEESLR